MTWAASGRGSGALSGARLLIVDDEPLIAMDIERIFQHAGAEIVGPAGSIDEALELIRRNDLTCAVLDVRLRGGKTVAPVAKVLAGLGVPFLLYSGQLEDDAFLAQWPSSAFIAKPAPERALVAAMQRLLTESSDKPKAPRVSPETRPHGA